MKPTYQMGNLQLPAVRPTVLDVWTTHFILSIELTRENEHILDSNGQCEEECYLCDDEWP